MAEEVAGYLFTDFLFTPLFVCVMKSLFGNIVLLSSFFHCISLTHHELPQEKEEGTC